MNVFGGTRPTSMLIIRVAFVAKDSRLMPVCLMRTQPPHSFLCFLWVAMFEGQLVMPLFSGANRVRAPKIARF
jgi:hypothetical protein